MNPENPRNQLEVQRAQDWVDYYDRGRSDPAWFRYTSHTVDALSGGLFYAGMEAMTGQAAYGPWADNERAIVNTAVLGASIGLGSLRLGGASYADDAFRANVGTSFPAGARYNTAIRSASVAAPRIGGMSLSLAPESQGLFNLNRIHGNSALSPRTAYLYGMYQRDGAFLKWGTTQNLNKRYPKTFMKDHYLERVTSGNRADMLRMERGLVETQPGPWNREPWAGARAGGQP